MNAHYTPKQIAELLKISTTTLRRYEDQHLIPDVPRTDSNRRIYTEVHLQAFVTIRALLRGYEIPVVYEAMRLMKQGNVSRAFWLINRQQHDIQVEKQRVEEIMAMIRSANFTKYKNVKVTEAMTIGEVAAIASVNASAIRHWEQKGLIASQRNEGNGYRVFTSAELRKIIVISSLRKTLFFLDNMKQLLYDLETQPFSKVEHSFRLALHKLNHQLDRQFEGIAELVKYAKHIKEELP